MTIVSDVRHFHDVRATHDMANLRFDAGGADAWVILRIAPDPHSGSATMIGVMLDAASGAMLDARTGQIVTTPETVRSGIIEEGSWALVASLDGGAPAATTGRYSWTEPAPTRLHGLAAENIYHPFARGGVVLCRHHPTIGGSAQFLPVYLVPPGWEASVQVAHALCARDPAVFEGPDFPVLLHGDDPLLAAIAFRKLAETGAVDAIVLRHTVGRATGYKRAILVYLLMLHASELDADVLEQELQRVIDDTAADEQWPTVLGVVTARLLHPELPASQGLVPRLVDAQLRRIARTPAGPGTGPGIDDYVRQLLEAARLPTE